MEVYRWFVTKEKALYHALNHMKQGQATFIGYYWAPNDEEDRIYRELAHFPTTDIKRFENHTIKPPTYIKNNEFTYAFQEIVNTYGIPMYKEVNPAIFAIVSFPFLFGVMFGDIGHGGLWLFTGILLCIFNSKIKNSGAALFGDIRYLLLLMGIFAFYMGWIYNEFFAIPFEVFGSCYEEEPKILSEPKDQTDTTPTNYGFKRVSKDCVYTFGIDPRWS